MVHKPSDCCLWNSTSDGPETDSLWGSQKWSTKQVPVKGVLQIKLWNWYFLIYITPDEPKGSNEWQKWVDQFDSARRIRFKMFFFARESSILHAETHFFAACGGLFLEPCATRIHEIRDSDFLISWNPARPPPPPRGGYLAAQGNVFQKFPWN